MSAFRWPQWLDRIREDVRTARLRDPAAQSAVEVLLTYPGVHALFIHRLANRLWRARIPVLPRLVSHLSRFLTGIEIHPGATIGRRVFIDHGMGIVIGETAEVGDDCHLLQGATLGGTSTRREKRHPTLEHHVVVGAGAKLIGAITVGEHSRIGAGSVVVSSVPKFATVVGVPGHIVAYTNPSNETVERLPDPEWDRIDALERRIARLESELAGAQPPARANGGGETSPAPATPPLARSSGEGHATVGSEDPRAEGRGEGSSGEVSSASSAPPLREGGEGAGA